LEWHRKSPKKERRDEGLTGNLHPNEERRKKKAVPTRRMEGEILSSRKSAKIIVVYEIAAQKKLWNLFRTDPSEPGRRGQNGQKTACQELSSQRSQQGQKRKRSGREILALEVLGWKREGRLSEDAIRRGKDRVSKDPEMCPLLQKKGE